MSPKRAVGCRGGSRYGEGCWGFPYLKIKNIGVLGIPLLEIKSFLVSRLQSFKVSNFQNSKFPKFQSFIFQNAEKSICVGHLFPIFSRFPNIRFQGNTHIYFFNALGLFLDWFKVSWCLQR